MTDSQRLRAVQRVCTGCGALVGYGSECPHCETSWRRFCRAIGVALLAAAACLAALYLAGCCTTWQCRTRTALDAVSLATSKAVPAMAMACDKVLLEVKAAGCTQREQAACDPLRKCHAVEQQVAKAALASQAAVLVGLGAIDLATEPTAARALQEALAAWAPLRAALKAYGVEVP